MINSSQILVSTAYLPPIEYIALLLQYQNICVEVHESYAKQTYRNRCKIMTANGVLNLTIPVNKINGNNTKTGNIQIMNEDNWQINHWRAINSAYSGSPFYLYYKDDLEEFFFNKYNSLVELNTKLLLNVCHLIGFTPDIRYTESFIPIEKVIDSYDCRFNISPKKDSIFNDFGEYFQVFSTKYPFEPNLSIIDLLFNLGPETKQYITELYNDWKTDMK